MSNENHNKLFLEYCQSLNHYKGRLSKNLFLEELRKNDNILYHVLTEKFKDENKYEKYYSVNQYSYNYPNCKYKSDLLIAIYDDFDNLKYEYYSIELLPKNALKLLTKINYLMINFEFVIHILQTIKIYKKNKNKIRSVLYKIIMNDFISNQMLIVYPNANKIIDIIYDELRYDKSFR